MPGMCRSVHSSRLMIVRRKTRSQRKLLARCPDARTPFAEFNVSRASSWNEAQLPVNPDSTPPPLAGRVAGVTVQPLTTARAVATTKPPHFSFPPGARRKRVVIPIGTIPVAYLFPRRSLPSLCEAPLCDLLAVVQARCRSAENASAIRAMKLRLSRSRV